MIFFFKILKVLAMAIAITNNHCFITNIISDGFFLCFKIIISDG